jgi:ribosomal protein S12 methylthiotransferase
MKIGLVSLGCPKNLVDGEVMLGLARDAGHQITADAAEAEVIVVNTCAFIESARQESIDTILEMAGHKRGGACGRLVVTGCLAERYRDRLREEMPEIDVVLGTGEVPQVVRALEEPAPLRFFRGPAGVAAPSLPDAGGGDADLPTYLYDAGTPRILTTPRHVAYLKVAEGCDYTCAFCIIPRLRGTYRSRPAESILREARTLADRGVKELILISQDTTFYGIDRRERGALPRLLRELNAIDGLEWIRLLYLYPTTIGLDALEAMAECEKVCRYVDLPLQHASDPVLRRMGRPGSRRTYDRLLARIRERVPGVAIRTTFIVGFPGETGEDFDALTRFVADSGFDHVGVFTYSHEEGTRAYALADDVPPAVKRRRRNRLMSLQKQLVRRRQRGRRGEQTVVLVEGPSAESPLVLQGRLESQAPEIDPVAYLTECDPSAYPAGTLVRAEIVGARDYDLVVRPLL